MEQLRNRGPGQGLILLDIKQGHERDYKSLRRSVRKYFSKGQGFTLLELMVVLAIFTIVLGASYALLSAGRTGSYLGETKIELQEELRRAIDVIMSELSASVFTKVTIGAGGDYITFQTPVCVDGRGSWEDTDLDGKPDFYLENTLDSSGSVRWGAYLRGEGHDVASAAREGRWVMILLDGDELIRRVLNSDRTAIVEDFPLADNLQNISFIRVSDNIIRIDMGARKLTIDRHPIVYSLSTEAYLRSGN